VHLGATFVADGEAAVAGEPAQRSLHDPAIASQPLARLDPPPRDAWHDAPATEERAAAVEIVALVCMHFVWPFAAIAEGLFDRRQGGDQPFELDAVVLVGRRERQREGDPAAVDDEMLFAARLPTVRWVRSDEEPPFLAGTLRVSTATRLQSSWPCAPSSSRSR